jgi:hypothetical protein
MDQQTFMRVAGGLCAGAVLPEEEQREMVRPAAPSLHPAVIASLVWAFSAGLVMLVA